MSNALGRSRNTAPVKHPLSIVSRDCSVKAIKAVEVECFSWKSICDSDNSMFSSNLTEYVLISH